MMATETIESRFDDIFQRLEILEQFFGLSKKVSTDSSSVQSTLDTCKNNPEVCSSLDVPAGHHPSTTEGVSECEQRLTNILKEKGFKTFKFVRVPEDYYDKPLEFRKGVLGAPSIEHLCKSIVMVNTKAQVEECSNSKNSKYYLVIIQYTEERTHGEKLKNFLHKLNDGTISKKGFNLRLAPQEDSDRLSGFSHNAVSPIGFHTPMPIILSHKIASLQPGYFFMGAGEVDLKLCLCVDEFIEKYNPYVVDCTY